MTTTPTPAPTLTVPPLTTLEEIAEWHDTHDTGTLTDVVELPSPVAGKSLSSVFTVRFDPDTVTRLTAAARQHGVGVTQLVRMWVLERLDADLAPDTATWTAGLTDDALAEIRAVVERTITTAATHRP